MKGGNSVTRFIRGVTRFDLLNFSVSALRDGISSLYGLYLVSGLGLGPGQIGQILSAATAASLLGQVPLGYLYDQIHRKGVVVAAGAVGMGGAALILGSGSVPSFAVALGAQLLFGLSMSTLSAGMPALTVAITTDRDLGDRLMRNEIFSKIGNLSTLAMATWLTSLFELRVIFVIVPILALPVVWLALSAPAPILNTEPILAARPSGARRSSPKFFWLVAIIFLYFLSNTAALPLFEQAFAPLNQNGGAQWIASASVINMAAVTLTILALSRVVGLNGLTSTLTMTFGLIAFRLGVLSGGPTVAVLFLGQIIDGVIDGILVTVPTRLLAIHHRKGFAIRAGFLGAVASTGAFGSTMLSGPLMLRLGYPQSLWAYVFPAVLGLGLMLFARKSLAA